MQRILNIAFEILLCPFVYLSARLLKKVNDRPLIRALLFKVQKESRGPQLMLSRTHPDFVKKLFDI